MPATLPFTPSKTPHRPPRASHASCLALLALGALTGCPASLPEGATALSGISIEGNAHVSSSTLVDAIASDPTHKFLGVRMWWVDYGIYDPVEVDKDLRRIERYYRSLGYYEAHVLAGTVVHTSEHQVRVQVRLEEGPKVVIGAIEKKGLEGLPPAVRDAVVGALELKENDAFEEKEYHGAALRMRTALTEAGYAYAKVRLRSEVDLITHKATIELEAEPGPRCTFGPLTIVGLKELPEHGVRIVIDIKEGDVYSTKILREAQHALFELGIFDTVEIDPDLSKAGVTVVPLTAKVTESQLRRVKAGLGFLIDPIHDDLHVVGAWENRNFMGGLRTFRTELRPLLVLKPGLLSVQAVRPGISTAIMLKQPSFLEARTTGSATVTTWIIPDPVDDYRTFSLRTSVGVERRLFSFLNVGFFYRKGFDFPTPYGDAVLPANVYRAQIGYLELLTSVDARDNALMPHRGAYAALSLQYAFASKFFLAGDFGDVRVQPEVRGYLPIAKGVTLAVRALTGFLFARNYTPHEPGRRTPTADDPSSFDNDTSGDTPLWRAFFSGGSTSNRGYSTRSVGLRDCAPGQVGEACAQAIGGATLWEASIELRFEIIGDLSGAIFLDGSDVSRKPVDIRLSYPHLSAGPGLRYTTPFGPLRVDFGWRLPGLQRLGGDLDPREEPQTFSFVIHGPYALHLSIGEAF